MKTFTVYNDPGASYLRPGQVIYPVLCRHLHRGDERLELRTQPGRTNLGHEPKSRGWLGTTNDVERFALGEYTVVGVRYRVLTDGRERVDVKVRVP